MGKLLFFLFDFVGRFSKSRGDQIHGNEDLRAQILDREEKRGKKESLSTYGTKRKSNFGKT